MKPRQNRPILRLEDGRKVRQDITPILPAEYIQLFRIATQKCGGSQSLINTQKLIRKYIIYQMLSKLTSNHEKRSVITAEFGVYTGLTSMLIADKLCDKQGKHYIFDSFEGLSSATSEDNLQETTLYAMSPNITDIKKLFPKAILQKCWIPDQLKDIDCSFDFVHIDLDLYEPILGALNYLTTRTNPGCIIIIDDFNSRFPGCEAAVSKHLNEHGDLYSTQFDTLLGNYVLIRKSNIN